SYIEPAGKRIRQLLGIELEGRDDEKVDEQAGGQNGRNEAHHDHEESAEIGEKPAQASPCPAIIIASSARRSDFLRRSDSDLSCPQAARMSRPRGVRIGDA